MSQSEEARTREPGMEAGDNQTPKRLDSTELLQNEPESGERLSTRDTTDKIDSRGKDNQQSTAKLTSAAAQDGRMEEEAEGEDAKNQPQSQEAMLLEDLPHEQTESQDQMLKEQLSNELKASEDPSKDFFGTPGMQAGMKKKPGRPPLKREPGLVGPSAKTKSYSGGGASSGKHAKGKRAGTVREHVYDGSHTAKPTHSAPSRSRKDFMTYEEMIASVNLLRYLDWEKLNPKSHQNSPRKLSVDSVNNPPMLPIALWFWMCFQYFPRLTREQLSFAQQVVNKLPEFGVSGSSSVTLAGPGTNQYVPIFCLQKVIQALTSAGLSTLIAPIHSLLSKQYKGATPASTSQNKKNIRGGASNTSRTLLATSLHEFLEDKRNEKKFRLQYTVADDMFLSQLRAAVLRIGDKPAQTDTDMMAAETPQPSVDKLQVLKERGHTPLEEVIQKMQDELAEQSQKTQNCLKALHRKIEADRNNQLFFEGTFKSDHLLQDIQSSFKDEMLFLDIMEYKQQNQVTCSILDSQERRNKYSFPEKERPKKSEDYVCQICNDGDYSDENQIVFCSRCNISFHQRCYGIPQIPQGNWICDLCKYHGPEGRLIRCALCTRRGGCLRRTYIPARDEFWKARNKNYWEYCSEGDPIDPSEPPAIYSKDGQTSLIDDDVSVNSENFEEFLYYDYYQELDKWRMGDDQLEPKTHLAWVHLSCCMWISDLEMTLEPAPNKVKNLENLDKLRFNLECGICGKKEGACIQCHNRNCAESFHVECARRTKMFMEARNSENRFFTIYCEKHAPLEAKRKLESSAANNCNLITKFCRNVEKLFESYRPRCVEKPIDEETPGYIRQLKKRIAERQQAGRQQNGGDDELFSNPFIKTVRFEVQKYPDYGNVIEIKLDPETGDYVSADYSPPTSSIWKDLICKTHPVWEQLSKAHDWYQPLVYKKYKRLMNGSDELPFDHLVKVKIPRSQRNKKKNADYDSDEISYIADDGIYFIENTEKFDNELYCICQRPWNGELMTECLKCVKWFHPKCIGIEETDEVKLNQMDIICLSCSGKTQEIAQDHTHSEQEPCLGKRGSQGSLDEEHINNLQQNDKNEMQPEEPQGPSKPTETGENEVVVHLEFGIAAPQAAEPTSDGHGLKNGHASEAGAVVGNGVTHHKDAALGLESSQRQQMGASQPGLETRDALETAGLKKTPSTKQEALFVEGGKKSSTRSPLGLTPTKQHNITQYFPVLAKSPANTNPEQLEEAQDRQAQS